MAKIYKLTVKHFRGIQNFSQVFKTDFVCLIGRGDSGKSSILDAIAYVLSPNWNVQLFDNDFYNCDTGTPISIEATISDVPEELFREDKFGLYMRGLISQSGEITDVLEDIQQSVLTIQLVIDKDLEPKWSVITEREVGNKSINASDRAKLSAALVSDYVDRHFSWNRGGPLYTLLQQEEPDDDLDGTHMIDALRDAKTKIDGATFSKFETAVNKVKNTASAFGINISKASTTIDFKELVTKDGKVSLHDEKIPFRLKGKGSKRLISIAIQAAIASEGGIALIDEVEQGLESDRARQLVNSLKSHTHGQVFVTTHSRDVLVELSAEDVYLMRKGASKLISFDQRLQGVLRKNPEAFFAKAIVLCEGQTEMGVGRSLNSFRITNGQKNMAYTGVVLANGEGSLFSEYAIKFANSGFPVCVFCDSDTKISNDQKVKLKALGIEVLDWDSGDCLEVAIIKELPFDILKKMFELAVNIQCQEDSELKATDVKNNLWDSIKSRLSGTVAKSFDESADSIELRAAIGQAAAKNGWFKKIGRAYALGSLIFDNFEKIPEGRLKKNLNGLSAWIESHGS